MSQNHERRALPVSEDENTSLASFFDINGHETKMTGLRSEAESDVKKGWLTMGRGKEGKGMLG